MSWRSRLATYDDATLESLSSAGALRRAKKGKLSVEVVGEAANEATLRVGDRDVRLLDAPLDSAACSCPASGVCVHILAAALQLRETGATTTISAIDELESISVEAALRWAGKVARRKASQWLAADPDAPAALVVTEGPSSVELRLDEEHGCRYAAGGGLEGIVCDAPASRRKTVILCCLLAYRALKGDAIAFAEAQEPQTQGLTADERAALSEIKAQVRRLIDVGLGHAGEHLLASLRALAWSSRGERLPRLSTLLHQLCSELTAFRDGAGDTTSGRVLSHASAIWRLVEELEASAHPDRLRGEFRRGYEPAPVQPAWLAGLSRYETHGGARGFALVFVELDSGRLLHMNLGRAGEAARTFVFESALHGVLGWEGASSPASMLGEVLHLDSALLSEDGRISASKQTRVVRRDSGHEHHARLLELGQTSWEETRTFLRAALATRDVGYVLLRPSRAHVMRLDEQAQRWVGSLVDAAGRELSVSLPSQGVLADRVPKYNHLVEVARSAVHAVLVEAIRVGGALFLQPISLTLLESGKLRCVHLDLRENELQRGAWRRWLDRFRPAVPASTEARPHPYPGVAALIDDARDLFEGAAELGTQCALVDPDRLSNLRHQLEIAGAANVLALLDRSLARPSASADTLLEGFYILDAVHDRVVLDSLVRSPGDG